MSYSFEHILNKHKGEVCIVALHGSSLNPHKEQIESLQKENKAIRMSTNEWFNYFSEKPDYWIVSKRRLIEIIYGTAEDIRITSLMSKIYF